jgi:hypothetical protein
MSTLKRNTSGITNRRKPYSRLFNHETKGGQQMIKEECKEASRFLQQVFQGDIVMIATIVTAEANNDFETLLNILLRIQSATGKMIVALKKAEERECQG